MTNVTLYPRFIETRLREALSDTPVVLVHGPRQSGKTTLARTFGESAGYRYVTFDDDVQRSAAAADPVGFVADLPRRVVLDEVQRVPGLFTSLKAVVDRDRTPGRFILTGSANVLTVPKLADSLAGRMEVLRLHPLAQAEIEGVRPRFLDALMSTRLTSATELRLGRGLPERMVAGGYPAALVRSRANRRAAWYREYVDALVQRDVRELARVGSLQVLPRLLAAAAADTARLLNVADLAAPFQLSRPTIREYVTLLEHVFLLEELAPWHSNRMKRLVKTPKLHLVDSGVACSLLGIDAQALWSDKTLLGQLLETFVYQELRREASWRDDALSFFHFRDRDGVEVDIVIERGGREVFGIEVKATATVTESDFRGLRKLREACGARFVCGVLLYDGEATVPFGDRLFAVPLGAIWRNATAR